MKKTIAVTAVIALIACIAFWAKGYYNDRYVASDSFYTQIPADEPNEDSWLADADGIPQEKGREYDLIGYNQEGEEREISFIKRGTAKDYYTPGTYIKVSTSKTLVVGIEVVGETHVPKAALDKISSLGTRKCLVRKP